jgi:protein-tyrosine kinase
MSIIERALHKAQKTKGAAATPVQSNGPVAEPESAPDTVVPLASPGVAQSSPQPDHASLTARDMKRIVDIDLGRLRERGRVPPVHAAHQTEEEFRRIKWPLLSALAGRGGSVPARNNVVLVTSAVPAEGKSYTSLNLALSIVRDREMRVILVDGDVALPGLTPTLDLEGALGLNDVLDDPNMDVSEITYRTTVEGLLFVPAGRWHEHSPELVAGSRMPQVIDQLSRRVGNGVVIFDSPPLLATNEAQVATRYVGHVLLVVRADATEQREVMDAMALVDKSTPVSAVLNCVESSLLSKYYGQHAYGYGYGYGARRGPAGGPIEQSGTEG